MSASPCTFREPPDVVRGADNSHGVYVRVGQVGVLLHRLGHAVCLTCLNHTGPHGTGCAATRAAEAWQRGQVGAGRAAA